MKHILIIFSLCFLSISLLSQKTTRVIIDTDSGNEVDDLYAVVRGLIEPSWDVVALNATQWQSSQWAVANTMEESYRINQVLVGYLKMEDKVPARRGGADRMYDWGDKARYSAAATEIIRQAHQIPEGEMVTVIALGALTNVASALYIDPSISSKIVVYWLGTSYDFDRNIMKKTDFNAVMDVQATDIMLTSDVEMHIIPVNVASAMVFNYEDTKARLEGLHPLADFLLQRWFNHLDGGRYQRTIWDLGLIEVMIHPEYGSQVKIKTSPENGNRYVWYYNSLDAGKARDEFFSVTRDYLENMD